MAKLNTPDDFEKIPPIAEMLFDTDTVKKRVSELGQEISDTYRDQGELLLVCILKGGVVFLTDLMREISIPHAIDFMAISSYGVGKWESSGEVRIDMDLQQTIKGKHVLIIEDIIDSGNTLSNVIRQLETRNPKSLKVCCLLSKPERRKVENPVAFLGFEIQDKFVFGYGLDLDEEFRNVPFIGVIDADDYKKYRIERGFDDDAS